jgi:hypothetical protein
MPEDMYFGAENMSVVADGINLWLTFPTGIQLDIYPISETSFFYVDSMGWGIQYEINFDVGEDGKATRLEFIDGEKNFTCERQSDEILLELTPLLQVEKEGNETGNRMVRNEKAAPDSLLISLVAGGIILLGGGLAIFLKTRKE